MLFPFSCSPVDAARNGRRSKCVGPGRSGATAPPASALIHLKSNSGIETGRTRRRRSRRRADAQRAEGQTVHWPFPPFPNNSASADRATLSRTTQPARTRRLNGKAIEPGAVHWGGQSRCASPAREDRGHTDSASDDRRRNTTTKLATRFRRSQQHHPRCKVFADGHQPLTLTRGNPRTNNDAPPSRCPFRRVAASRVCRRAVARPGCWPKERT